MQSSPELESAFSQVRLRTSESQPTLETEKNGALPTSLAPFQPMIQGCGAGQRQPGAQRRGANSKLTGRMRPLGPTAIAAPPSLQGGTFKCTKGPATQGMEQGQGSSLQRSGGRLAGAGVGSERGGRERLSQSAQAPLLLSSRGEGGGHPSPSSAQPLAVLYAPLPAHFS